jgi:hypothetical protein
MLKCPIRVFKFSKKDETLESSVVHRYEGSKFSEIVLYYESDARHYWYEVDRTYENKFDILKVSKKCELLCYQECTNSVVQNQGILNLMNFGI